MIVPIARSRTARRATLAVAFVALAVLLAGPAVAETYLITLQNGGTIQSRYQPQESSWDAGMVLFMTESGNWIGIKKSDIVNVEQENNLRGFGFVINPTTIALGWAPNDAVDPSKEEADLGSRLLQALGGGNTPAPAKENYTVQQGVSTGQTQGIPLSYIPGSGYGASPQAPAAQPNVVVIPQTVVPNSDSAPRQ